ncbi:MAG: dockerin type I domain-containing protein, partial [Verrucomicrobiales bacterium]
GTAAAAETAADLIGTEIDLRITHLTPVRNTAGLESLAFFEAGILDRNSNTPGEPVLIAVKGSDADQVYGRYGAKARRNRFPSGSLVSRTFHGKLGMLPGGGFYVADREETFDLIEGAISVPRTLLITPLTAILKGTGSALLENPASRAAGNLLRPDSEASEPEPDVTTGAAGKSHHNRETPMDVDGDGYVSQSDVVRLVRALTEHRGDLPIDVGKLPETSPDLDVDGDGFFSPLDAKAVMKFVRE